MTTDVDSAEHDRGPLDPTPAQIAVACERIQATWSEAERRRRAGLVVKVLELLPSQDRRCNGEPMAANDL